MNYFLQSFFLGAGGLSRYIFFKIINILLSKNFSEDIDYYLSKEDTKDKNGLSTPQKNFIAGILVFCIILAIIEGNESK